jgi:diguanylate cyclase (GGDEF)-like protein
LAPHPLLDHPALRYLREDVTLLDGDGRILGTTMEHDVTIGYAPGVWLDRAFFDFVDPRDEAEIRRGWTDFVREPGATRTCEVRFRTADGLPSIVELDLKNYLHDPEWNAILAVGRNVTDVRAALEQLEHQNELLEKIGRGDTDDALVDIADLLMRQVGRARVAIASIDETGERHIEIGRGLGSATIELLMDGASGVRSHEPTSVVVFEPAKSPRSDRTVGGVLLVLDEARALADHEQRAIEGAATFVATVLEQRRQHERLAYKARYDDLTGALNRSHLRDRVAQALRRRECSIAMLLVDIDRFQLVNDSYGHNVGDQLLRAFTKRIARFLDTDDVLARFGGDEFAILIVQRHATDAAEVVAERLMRALAEPFAIGGREIHVSVGVGIARRQSGECEGVDQLLAEADAALTESKQRGRGSTTVFEPEIHDRLLSRLQLEDDLRRAIRDDELTLHYQPTYDLGAGGDADPAEVVGVEALVRWPHRTDGLLLPGAFVPLAEDAGLIEALGAWVLERAVAQAAEWVADGVVGQPFLVAVNVAAGQLAAPGLTELVQDVLARYDWPASNLVLELTETSLMIDCELARQQLDHLERLGVKLAIDDFGTGYSSLSYLHRFAVDIVKLDRSLVAAMGESEQGHAVARAVSIIAESLGLASVAEGVETPDQLELARSLGFDWAQGILLSPPVDAGACRELLTSS